MPLTEERLAGLLTYCRITEPAPGEEALLEGLYDAAVGYLEQAGVEQPPAGTTRAAQYDLAVNYLVLDAFDRREATEQGTPAENPAFRRLVNQLKLSEPQKN